MSKKTILLFILCYLCTDVAFAQYFKNSVGERTNQMVEKMHQRNVNIGKSISEKKTKQRRAQEKEKIKEWFEFKDLTIVASYDNYQRKSNLIMTKLNSSGDWIDYIYLSNTAGNKNCGFCIASRAGLRDSLFKIYDKYVEWKKIAEENHITSVKKTIPVSLPFATLYHYDGLQAVNHGFKKDVKPIRFNFIVSENGAKVIEAYEFQNLDPGFLFNNWVCAWLRFRTPEEFLAFIKKIDEEAFYKQLKINTMDLFK